MSFIERISYRDFFTYLHPLFRQRRPVNHEAVAVVKPNLVANYDTLKSGFLNFTKQTIFSRNMALFHLARFRPNCQDNSFAWLDVQLIYGFNYYPLAQLNFRFAVCFS